MDVIGSCPDHREASTTSELRVSSVTLSGSNSGPPQPGRKTRNSETQALTSTSCGFVSQGCGGASGAEHPLLGKGGIFLHGATLSELLVPVLAETF